jgi:SAM-dependent methyltransferase
MEKSKTQARFDAVAQSKTFHNIVRRFSLDKKSVLDVGCTFGEFLIHFGPRSVGITIIKEEADYGHSIGLDIRLGSVEDQAILRQFEGSFEVIFANNIFEHLQSPHLFLEHMKTCLAPDGFLVLGVPCIPSISSLMKFKKFRGSLASLHINFFTRKTLIKTVEYAGWEVLETRGFHFSNSFIDAFLNPVYPHFYVVAKPKKDFQIAPKRLRELAGYPT